MSNDHTTDKSGTGATRRGFLRSTALAGAGLTAARAVLHGLRGHTR